MDSAAGQPPQLVSPQRGPVETAAAPQAPQIPPGATRKGWINLWWVTISGRLRRYSPRVADIWYDGIYLTRWPRVAAIAPLLALALGLLEGATHWNFLPGDTVLGSAQSVTFTELLPFMILVAAASALSANLGLLLVIGYAFGDFIIAGPQLAVYFESGILSNQAIASLLYLRLPQLLSYIVFLQLVIVPTLGAKYLLVSLRRLLVGSGPAPMILRSGLMACLQGALVYAWTQAAPLQIRILWSWINSLPPLSAAYFLQVHGGWIVAVAAIVAAVRAWLMGRAYQDPVVRGRLLRLSALWRQADRHPAFTQHLPSIMTTGLAAGLTTLLASGIIGNKRISLAVFAFLWLVLLLRIVVLPRVSLWEAWTRLLARVPLLIRLALSTAGAYYVAQWTLAATQNLPLLTSSWSGTFQPLLFSLAAVLIWLTLLLPYQKRVRRQPSTVPRSSQPQPAARST